MTHLIQDSVSRSYHQRCFLVWTLGSFTVAWNVRSKSTCLLPVAGKPAQKPVLAEERHGDE